MDLDRKDGRRTTSAATTTPPTSTTTVTITTGDKNHGTIVMKSQEKEEIIPYTTLEKWSRLAERLKGKLEVTQRENDELKERLTCKSAECENLREEHAFQIERIDDLEFQCLEKSAKISNLSDLLETRGEPNELQEKLLSKSLEHAEISLSVDRLRLALQKSESSNQALLQEKETLLLVNEELSKKVEDYASAWERSTREQERNRKLLIEMGDVVRTLNCATIEFEKESRDSGASSHPNSLQNIKRKIQAMEEDRQRLIKECESLRQENNSNHLRIEELESQFLSYSTAHTSDSEERSRETSYRTNPLDCRLETQTSPVSIATKILEQGNPSFMQPEEYDDGVRSVASVVSSFSVLEPPPTVPLQEHETLKQYYQEALERIVRMSADLGKSKAAVQDLQQKDTYVEELRERLQQMQQERDDALKENLALEKQLEQALALAEKAARKHNDFIKVHEKQIADQKKKHEALKDKYNNIEKEYSDQLEELERQIAETEKFFQLKCEGLKKQHLDMMEAASKEKEDIDKIHMAALAAEREKFNGLNEEFDVFMEMHTEIEDELSDLKKKYDEALTTIVDLEDQVKATKNIGEAEKAKLEKRIDEQTKAIWELKATVEKSNDEMQEAVLQQQNLRRENENVLAKHGDLVVQLNQAKEQKRQDDSTLKGLRDNCCDMESRLKRIEQDASTRFNQLHVSYQMAISKISTLATQVHGAGLPIGESMEDPLKKVNFAAHEKIRILEQELMGEEAARFSSELTIDPDAQRFHKDYCHILISLAEGRKAKSRKKTISPQPLWYHRLVHQAKAFRVHEALLERYLSLQAGVLNHVLHLLLFDFLRHQRRLQPALGALMIFFQSRLKKKETVMTHHVESSAKAEIKDSLMNNDAFQEPSFSEHQQRLTEVHHDVIGRIQNLSSATLKMAMCAENRHEGNHDTIETTEVALQQIQGETQTINMAANTAKIRYEAREKEHRLVRLQYQKLLQQYNEALDCQRKESLAALDDSLGSSQKVKMAVEKIHKDAELQRLKTELRAAELKVERMTIELRASKSKAEDAQKKQEDGEKNLQDAIVRHEKQLEADHDQNSPTVTHRGIRESKVSQIFRSNEALAIVDEHDNEGKNPSGNGDTTAYKVAPSFDGSQLTSFGGISSTEDRDERCDDNKSGRVHFEGGIGRYLQLQQEHDQALQTIEELKIELEAAKQSAEYARTLVKQREEDLRDVIREYNHIKNESDKLFEQIQDQIKKEVASENDTEGDAEEDDILSPPVISEDIIRERNMALGKISMLESELEIAWSAAKGAKKKQQLREAHLRQVIDQYKELNREHQEMKAQVQELQAALAQYSPRAGMETRQRSQESEDDRRESRVVGASREQLHVNFRSDETERKGSRPFERKKHNERPVFALWDKTKAQRDKMFGRVGRKID